MIVDVIFIVPLAIDCIIDVSENIHYQSYLWNQGTCIKNIIFYNKLTNVTRSNEFFRLNKFISIFDNFDKKVLKNLRKEIS